jgi:nuclear transcription factor Y alpha
MVATVVASNLSQPRQTSLGLGVTVKRERGPGLPQQVSQVGCMSEQPANPAVQHSQRLMNGAPHQTEQYTIPGAVEESPLYVNAKQFHCILKRRVARQRLEEALRLTSKGRKPYLHESRHNHAMRRPRGPGGRYLTADEVAEIERTKGDSKETLAKGTSSGADGSLKRKAALNT